MRVPPVVNHPSKHFSSRAGASIGAIVLHHTAGTDSLKYLTENAKGVSTHSLIDKPGTIYRMVADHLAAHTVGFSNLGRYTVAAGDKGSANQITFNIELENLGNGTDPYPEAQRDACGYEIARIWHTFGVVPVLTHEIIDTQGKNDPHGLDLADVLRRALAWYDSVPGSSIDPYTEFSRICSASPPVTPAAIAAQISPVNGYTAYDIQSIVKNYWDACLLVGVNPLLAIAQMCHETGNLSSFWAARPQRNPAGLGVTGEWSNTPKPGYVYNPTRTRYEAGLSFVSWEHESVFAHVGRLVAYAIKPEERTSLQQQMVNVALSYRDLPDHIQGSAPMLRQLGADLNPTGEGWADPGTDYGAKIAAKANRLLEAIT